MKNLFGFIALVLCLVSFNTRPTVVYTQPQTVVQVPPVGYHWQEMLDPQTGIKRVVAVPN